MTATMMYNYNSKKNNGEIATIHSFHSLMFSAYADTPILWGAL